MRSAPTIVATAVSGLVLAVLPAGVATSAHAGGPHTPVVPTALPSGPAPRIAYTDGNTLVRPGRRSVDLGGVGGAVARVRRGYLVAVAHPRGNGRYFNDIDFVADSGRRRLFKRTAVREQGRSYDVADATVSSTGRLVAFFTRVHGDQIVITRVSDGHTIARHRALRVGPPRYEAHVMAFQGRRILLREVHGNNSATASNRVIWWNLDSRRRPVVVPATRFSRVRPWLEAVQSPADVSSHRVVISSGRREVVRRLPGHRGSLWRTRIDEHVQSWSPDGRYVLTAADPGPFYNDEDVSTRSLRVRRSGSGRVVAGFTGLLFVDTRWHHGPVWETSNSFLLLAWSGTAYNPRNERDEVTDPHWIRCRVSSVSCETALTPDTSTGPVLTPYAVRPSS
jgi:hypothetical protein